jgi:DNA-binding winged helix-turn-helix (wHTH) protein/predicted ATPase
MDAVTALSFGPYCLAGPKGPLTRDGREITLRPKTLRVLWHLAEHGGEIIEQESLVAAVWPDRIVSPGVLGVSIRELRQVFDDDPKAPRYIRTVHRIGYQFLPPVHAAMAVEVAPGVLDGSLVVGREAELQRLDQLYQQARLGRRQLLFVTGEAGIGKSTLVQAWMQRSLGTSAVWFGFGQCVEHLDGGETYLALLEALNRLCLGNRREAVVATLRRHAPGWLAQLPAAVTAEEREALLSAQSMIDGQHFQRGLADALEALSASQPIVLLLEDLHWCDAATVEILAVLARRPESARLFVIGTTRPLTRSSGQHPLRALQQELTWHNQCTEVALTGLDEAAVRTYLARRLPADTGGDLAEVVYRRTAGQPLFMVNLTDYLVQTVAGQDVGPGSAAATDLLVQATTALPSGLADLIDGQVERLDSTERQVLEAASVAGLAFAAAAIGPTLELPDHEIETVCIRLAQRDQFVTASGVVEWPDGTASEGFAFRHQLYRETLYRGLGISRRMRLHRLIGERLANGYGAEAASIAAELAEHFEQGRDYRRAMHYCRLAAESALRRFAPGAALAHLERGAKLGAHRPRDDETVQEQLQLELVRGAALIAREGFGASAVARVYDHALALCRQLPGSPALGPALCGLWNYFLTRADFARVPTLAAEIAGLLDRADETDCLTPLHNAIGQTHLFAGEPAQALPWIAAGLESYDHRWHRDLVGQYGEDPLVVCHQYAALVHALLGHADQSLRQLHAGLEFARDSGQPFGIAQMLWMGMVTGQLRADPSAVQTHGRALIRLCRRERIGFWLASGRVLQGWAMAMRGRVAAGLVSIRCGLADCETMGFALMHPYHLALLAEVLARGGETREALDTIGEALAAVQRTGEHWYEAGLQRLRGKLLAHADPGDPTGAESAFQLALTIARRQQAGALELGAALDLARLWLSQDRGLDSRQLLMPVHERLIVHGETADLAEAARMIDALA